MQPAGGAGAKSAVSQVLSDNRKIMDGIERVEGLVGQMSHLSLHSSGTPHGLQQQQQKQQPPLPVTSSASPFPPLALATEEDCDRMLMALRGALGQDASFREGQAAALWSMWKGSGSLLVNLSTGGGKNLLYSLLPRLCPDEVIIVEVPFKAVLENMASRCVEYGQQPLRWCDVARMDVQARQSLRGLLLVSSEEAAKPEFAAFLVQGVNLGPPIHCIIKDEGHITFTHGCTFRRKVLHGMLGWPTGLYKVVASATTPEPVMQRVAHYLLGPGQYFAATIRGNTIPQPQLRYEVRTLWVGGGVCC